MTYMALEWLHIVGATVLFGTGIGTAFHFWFALRTRNMVAIAAAARSTVVADFAFTLPAAILQPVTGVALAWLASYPLTSTWILASIGLYLLVGACWIPVVFIQARLSKLADAAVRDGVPPGEEFHRLASRWFLLGWPAFAALLLVLWLMVARPA